MEIRTNDQIANMNNKELRDLFFTLRAKINSFHKKGKECKNLEIHYCYVSRELEHREKLRNIDATDATCAI